MFTNKIIKQTDIDNENVNNCNDDMFENNINNSLFTNEIINQNNVYNENDNKNCNNDIFKKIKYKHLNEQELKCLRKLISDNKQIFYNENDPFTFTTVMKHSIRMKDDIPVHTKSYRFPHCHKTEIQKQVKHMLNKNIIRESCSPWSSPV